MNESGINFTIQELVEASVHYGHNASYWNPKMKKYIYGKQNGSHIINLVETHKAMSNALSELYKAGKNNKRILFVGTKPQFSKLVKKYAIECGQYYVNYKWLGGLLTNWKTISSSIKTLEGHEKTLSVESENYTKKELFLIARDLEKLEKRIGGVRQLLGKPDVIFVIDAKHEHIAIKEAMRDKIKIISIVDTNTDPTGIDIVIPGNDDGIRATELYLKLASGAILRGIKDKMSASGVDIEKLVKIES